MHLEITIGQLLCTILLDFLNSHIFIPSLASESYHWSGYNTEKKLKFCCERSIYCLMLCVFLSILSSLYICRCFRLRGSVALVLGM